MHRYLLTLLFLLVHCSFAEAQTLAGYTGLGSKAIERGDYTLALDYLNKAIRISQFNSEAFFLRGYAKYELDDFVGAEKDFGEALDLNPKNHEAFLYRGVCRSQLFKYQEAFADFNEAIRLNDEDWRVYANRALINLQLDRYVDALADCNRIIKLEKDNAQTYLLRGEAKSGLGMYRVAIEDFEVAMRMDSLAMQPVLRRGIARLELKRYQEAIADFNKAIEMETSNSLPVFYRGVAYMRQGNSALALADFNLVLNRYPENEVVLFNRAMLYEEQGRLDEALADYDRVIALNRSNILARFNRSILLYNKGKREQALTDLNKVIELFPEFLEAHETRLKLLEQMGDRPQHEKARQQMMRIRAMLSASDEEIKTEQQARLMKLTRLKGDFEQLGNNTGKVQYRKVNVRLMPFYAISPSPETDKDIAVYDGFGRPFYNMGVITFTSRSEVMDRRTAEAKLEQLGTSPPANMTEFIRSIPYYVYAERFDLAYAQLDSCLRADSTLAACYFARGYVRQEELENMHAEHLALIGDLNIIDTVYENKTERTVALIEADYRKVIELDPKMSFAHFNLGHVLASVERYEEAEVEFGKAASAAGNFIEANFNRGLVRLILGDTSAACEDLSLAGELGITDAYNIIKRYCE